MGDFATTLALSVLAVAIVLLAMRLRSTVRIGGSVQLKSGSDDRLSIEKLLAKELADSGSAKPVVTISMVTKQGFSGSPQSTEAITIDGQTYHSVDEIPPQVRERVRTLLTQARAKAGTPGPEAGAALVRIEQDLAALGLDLHDKPGSPEDPPGTT